MRRPGVTLFLIAVILTFLSGPKVQADDTSCILQAPDQNDVWVIVYNADNDGNRGDIIYKNKIKAGQTVEIISANGLIRYDFKKGADDPYAGGDTRECSGQRAILME